MGLSSKKTTQTNTPVYGPQIEGAASTLSGVYNTNAPKVQGYADLIGGMIPNLLDKYNAGNPAVNAAQGYITSTLGSDPANNPHLQAMIDQTNGDVRNKTMSGLGTRGLTGGSVAAQMVARELARNETGLRYGDYQDQMNRRAQAAGMAPSVAAADTIQIAPLLSAAETASSLPMQQALMQAQGISGLLGPYTKEVQKSSGGIGGLFGSILGSMLPVR